jgi:hypothetical protein
VKGVQANRRLWAEVLFAVALVLGIYFAGDLFHRWYYSTSKTSPQVPVSCGANLAGPGLICSQSIVGLKCVPDRVAYLCTGWNPGGVGLDIAGWVSAIAAAVAAIAAVVALLLPSKRSGGQSPSTGSGPSPSPSPT